MDYVNRVRHQNYRFSYIIRGGSWELAGSFVGGPIDGLGGRGAWEPAQADPSKLPITLHTGPCIYNV